MCGILGLIGKIETQKFKFCLDTISYRGPDGFGIWEDNDCMLGHRRLSIIDLSENAKQPFEILDRYLITYNGEIYNYKEIRKILELDGIKFKSESDTEVLLYSFLKWGENCFQKFNGMWSLAIWDKTEKTLLLCRDRIGKKPLYYCHSIYGFAFASEMKALYPLVGYEINHKQVEIAKTKNYFYESERECLVKNIFRFPSANIGIVKNGKLTFKKYWHAENNLIEVPKTFEEQSEQFNELFTNACKLRMRSDVQIGTALSGGLDSSATICTMAKIAKQNTFDFQENWQHAYIASFPGTPLDETKYAEKVINYLNINATYVNINPLKDIEKLNYFLYQFEELYLTSPIPMIQLYSEVKKNGTTVTIDGHGSDELFAGYSHDVIVALQDSVNNISNFQSVLKTHNNMMDKNVDLKDYLYHSAKIVKNKITDYFYGRTKLQQKRYNFDFLNSRLYESTFETVLPTLLRNYDRYSMINGVEVRMPFLDYRIIQFAFSIPWTSKVRNGYSKAIVREALKNSMPNEIVWRKAKIGFNSPFTNWIQNDLKHWVMDTLVSQSFKDSTIIDPKLVTNLIVKLIENKNATYTDGENAWKALMPYLWEKSFVYAKQ